MTLATVKSIAALVLALFVLAPKVPAQTTAPASEKIILDTDIGDDIDDAFALALLLHSPRVQLLGITTAWGETDLRARLVERFLHDTGYAGIPIAAGPATKSTNNFSQRRYAEGGAPQHWPDAADFILDQIRRYPGEVTLISIAPFTTVAAAIHKDPATFRRLRRVVIMGGSIRRGYGDLGYLPDHGPQPEYNVYSDVAASQALFTAGVPITMMPLDSTQLKLDEVLRTILFSQGTRTTDALTLLYQQWAAATGNVTPTLFDAMATAYVLDPSLCPTQAMHIRIDDRGNTIAEPGVPYDNVCLNSDSDHFFHFYFRTVLGTESKGSAH